MSKDEKHIKTFRLSSGLTQDGARLVMECSYSCWQKWEQGINPMPPYALNYFLLLTNQHPTKKIVEK